MSSAESRIVTMQFNNQQFEQGAQQSLTTLQKLKASLNFDTMKSGLSKASSGLGSVFSRFSSSKLNPFASATQGMSDLQKQANSFNTGAITGGVSSISKSFIAMSTIAITAISNITNRVLDAGISWAKGFTFAPLMDGLREYETNLKSMQTIQANTDRPLKEVEQSLDILNKYSDQTIYNFSEMARNVGTFTAAGVDLKTSVSSIKGIANMAALSGSSSQQAATAMYQLSQAISSGRVGLQDWNSVVNAGMGGKKLQNALAQTAIAMGEIDKAQVKGTKSGEQLRIMGNSFRESIMAKPGEESWLSSEILTNSLAALDGRYSAAALSAEKLEDGTLKYKDAAEVTAAIERNRNQAAKEGIVYTDEQFAALQKLSTAAFESATKVKTLGQVFDIAKETMASGWSATFRNIFGGLDEAKELFTGMSLGLNTIIEENSLARNNMLAAWKEGGGRDTLIEGLTSAWTAFRSVIGTVHEAFRDVFPAKTADDLLSMTDNFAAFTKSLIPGKDTLEDLKSTAAGVFAIFSIGVSIVKGIVGVIGDLFGVLTEGEGSFLNFTGGIGDFLVAVDDAIKKGGLLNGFFSGLTAVLSVPLTIIREVAEAIGSMFSGLDAGGLDGIGQRLSPLEGVIERIQGMLSGLGDFFSNLAQKAGEAFGGLGAAIADSFTAETFGQALDVINTALLGGIVLLLKNFFKGGASIDVGGGLFTQIKETLGGVTDALSTMQTNLKADILLKIAAAIGIMAVSLLLLATIDPKRLTSALVGLAATFGIMTVALVKLTTAMGMFGAARLPFIAAGLMGLSIAVLALAGAVKIFASMDLGTMLRGLTGVALTLYILTKAVVPLSANAAGMVRAGAGLVLIAIALRVMAESVERFGTMDLGTMAKGLGGIAASLLILAAAMQVMPKNIFVQAAALVVLGGALKVIGSAIAQLGNMDVGTLVTGIAAMAGSLVVIALAMRLMPGPTLLIQAAALVVLSGALAAIGQVVAKMGGLSMEEIAKGLGTLAGSLVILAAGLYLMTGSLAGSAALVVAAGALSLLVPVLFALGSMDISTIAIALGALAATFAVLGLSGLVLAPLLPILLGLGVVLVTVGAGLALAGAGALAFATAFGIVVGAAAAGAAVLANILGTIIRSIPAAMQAFGQGIVQFAAAIGRGAPQFYKAFSAVINGLLKAATQAIPKLGKLFTTLMTTALKIVTRLTPQVVSAGLRMIVQFLAAVAKNVPKITQHAIDIVVRFLNTLSKNMDRIIQAGVRLVVSTLNGIAKGIRENSGEIGAAGRNIASALIEGAAGGIRDMAWKVADAAKNMAKSAWDSAMNFLKAKSPSRLFMEVGNYVGDGFAIGMNESQRTVAKAGAGLGKSAHTAVKMSLKGVAAGIPEMDIRPTITPVLDLSEARNGAKGLSEILAQDKMRADISYRNAASVSDEMAAAAEAAARLVESRPSKTVNVEVTQHNTSPEPLDAGKIFRNTKSLMAITKEALESDERN